MANIAAIDIGTNSIRLMIASEELITIARKTIITRLGEDVDINNFMLKKNIKETIKVLASYLDLCKRYGVNKIYAVGTNVLRRALNSEHFLKEVYEKTGLSIKIISGIEEASYVFKGVAKNFRDIMQTGALENYKFIRGKQEQNILNVVDIGGGSCELITGSLDGNINYIKSIELGSVRITEKFFKKDKIETKDVFSAEKVIKKILSMDLNNRMIEKNSLFIGVGGTISSVGSIYLGLEKYEREKLNGLRLSITDIENIFMKLSRLSLARRKKVKSLHPERADIIIGGMAILLTFMKFFQKDFIIISEHGILDGIIYSLLEF